MTINWTLQYSVNSVSCIGMLYRWKFSRDKIFIDFGPSSFGSMIIITSESLVNELYFNLLVSEKLERGDHQKFVS